MITSWLNPAHAGSNATKQDVIFADSSVAPTVSPAPAGNPIVPAGYIRQLANDGSVETVLLTPAGYVPYITQFVVPYYSGGWPPDPLAGQPGHEPGIFHP